jgi:hypothetical protein
MTEVGHGQDFAPFAAGFAAGGERARAIEQPRGSGPVGARIRLVSGT